MCKKKKKKKKKNVGTVTHQLMHFYRREAAVIILPALCCSFGMDYHSKCQSPSSTKTQESLESEGRMVVCRCDGNLSKETTLYNVVE